MSHEIRRFASIQALSLVLGALAPATVHAAAGDRNVVVTNTTANPVPTVAQGTTAVSGSVSVTNTPTVVVGNTPATPIPVMVTDRPVLVPYASQRQVNYGNGNDFGDTLFDAVPSGYRLIIEHVSIRFVGPRGNAWDPVLLEMTTAGTLADYYLPVENLQTTNFDVYTSSLPVHYYADSGTQVRFAAGRPASSDQGFIYVTISGQLVPAP